MKNVILYSTLLATLLLSGCMTYTPPGQRRAVAQREDQLLLEERFSKLEGRIEGLESNLDRIDRALLKMERETGSSDEIRMLQSELKGLQQQITALDSARIKDRKEVVDHMSKEVAKLIQQTSSSQNQAGSGYGREHTVGPGQTLSEIAAAYGVKTSAIIKANSLKNPDRLQVGQTLFIPE